MANEAFDSKRDLLRAAEAAVETDARPGDQPGRRSSRPTVVGGGLLLLTLVGGWVLVTRPAWVFPPPAVSPAPEVVAASMRLALVRERERVERFREVHGRLPTTLAEAGSPLTNVEMAAGPDGGYLLRIVEGAVALDLHSSDNADAFLGRSMEILFSARGTP